MGYTVGLPSMKLNNVGKVSKHCGSFKGISEEALEERQGHDVDINKNLAEQNIFIGYRTAKELMEYSENHIKEINAVRSQNNERALRSDAVVMCATIIKPPAEMMLSLSEAEQLKFINDACEIFKGIVGEENIKSIAIHRDERIMHSHIFWEPITADGRLCAKEMHNLKFFNKVNTELPKQLREHGWTMVDDCKMYDKAEEDALRSELGEEKYKEFQKEKRESRGRTSHAYKFQAEQEKAELEKENETLKEKNESLQNTLGDAYEENARLTEEIENQNKTISENDKKIAELKRVVDELQSDYKDKSKAYKDIIKRSEGVLQTIKIPPRPELLPVPDIANWKEKQEIAKKNKQIQADIDVWDKEYKPIFELQEVVSAYKDKEKGISKLLKEAESIKQNAVQREQNAVLKEKELDEGLEKLEKKKIISELTRETDIRKGVDKVIEKTGAYIPNELIEQEIRNISNEKFIKNEQSISIYKNIDR